MFKKLHAKIDEVLAILRLLPALLTDLKATMAVVGKDVTDGKATLAQVQALTGHTATVVAMAAQAAVPTSVPIVLPTAPVAAAPTLQTDLAKDVAKVNPMQGVKLPGQ
jgi:nucleoside-diphosphate-sugar epimerase